MGDYSLMIVVVVATAADSSTSTSTLNGTILLGKPSIDIAP